MYYIMFVRSKKDGDSSLYQFETDDVNGVAVKHPYETLEELDKHVEGLLETHSKSDFIIVEEKGYKIDADLYVAPTTSTSTLAYIQK